LQHWVSDVSELLGNFEHNPDRIPQLIASMKEMQAYLYAQIAAQREGPREGVLSALQATEGDAGQLSEQEIVANVMLMIGGGLEEPANLICCGMLSLLQEPEQMKRLREDSAILASAVEELLRYNSPTQQTGRVAPEDAVLGGKEIRKGQALIVVLAAANRDPLRFPEPDRLDLARADNRHLAFGWAAHYCLGAPLARLAGQIAFSVLTQRLSAIEPGPTKPEWRGMASMRGLTSLPLNFMARPAGGCN
jgi:cytochrome P450